jgi:hypothetical protein
MNVCVPQDTYAAETRTLTNCVCVCVPQYLHTTVNSRTWTHLMCASVCICCTEHKMDSPCSQQTW